MKKLLKRGTLRRLIVSAAACCLLSALGLMSPAQAAVTFIPAANRVDMVHDAKRNMVYITNGDSVLRYNMATQSFSTPFTLTGAQLNSIDISPNNDTLIVTDRLDEATSAWVYLIDLNTGTPMKVPFSKSTYDGGTWAAVFCNDGAAIVTSRFHGSGGGLPLYRLDPLTKTYVSKGQVTQDSMVCASGDGSVVGFEESNSSGGDWGTYRVSDGAVTGSRSTGSSTGKYNYEIGVNRNGKQYAIPTYSGTFIYNSSFTKIKTIGVYAGEQPIGVVYHPTNDIVYFAFVGTREVRAYDTSTFDEVGRYDFGYTFTNNGNRAFNDGRLKTSRDGTLLFATVGGGVSYQQLPLLPPIYDTTVGVNNPRSLPEGSASAPGSVTFDITLNAASPQSVTVNYQTTNGSNNPATAGSDYVEKHGKVTFAPGETLKRVTVQFISDSTPEPNETFFLDLKTPTNAAIADGRGVGQINNDDGPTINIADAPTVNEGNGDSAPQTQTFLVTLSAPSTNTVTVNYATANGTATSEPSGDYTAASGTLTFAPGETSKSITITLTGDTKAEPNETYKVSLSKPTYAILGDALAVGIIRNDDATPQVFQDDPSQ